MRWLALYRVLVRVSLLDQLQYRASSLIWMSGAILEPLVFFVVWARVAEARGGSVAGFDARAFAAYYIATFVVNHLTFSWIMHVFQFRVQQGALSFELLRPVHPIHNDIAENLAYKILMSLVVLPAVIGMWIGFAPRFSWQPWSLACLLPALLFSYALRFVLEWILGLAAFWATRVMALNQIYFALSGFLAGKWAPLAVFPGWLQDAAAALPFYYCIAFPVELALGQLTLEQILRGFATQLAWLALVFAAITLLWGRAVRRFTAVGA
jgi:ABC-2 type transport system permease protein